MMSFSVSYRNNTLVFPFYCHICDQSRSHNQITRTENGDLMCLYCNQTGFVEKVDVAAADNPDPLYSRMNTESSPSDPIPDPFQSLFGVSLNSFITGMFDGSFAIPMTQTDPSVPAAVRFARDAENFFNQQDPSGLGPRGSRRSRGYVVNQDFSRVFTSLLNNPMDENAMNQILQYVMENDPNRYGPPPASMRIIDSLQPITLDAKEAKELGTCSVCTEDFKEGDKIHWLTTDKTLCGHPFHVDCIIPWLKQRNSCPVCRFELPTDDEMYNKDRENLRNRIAVEVQRNLNARPNNTNNNPPSE